MSLDLLRPLFETDDYFVRAIRMMLGDGDVTLIARDGSVVPEWKLRQLLSEPTAWALGTPYLLSLTDRGANRVS